MKLRSLTMLALSLVLVTALSSAWAAALVGETEPNNTPAEANQINAAQVMEGTLDPVGDLDYFQVGGVNTTWGIIALLDTISSTTSTAGSLEFVGADGSTVLQASSGSWARGAGIALQNYADDSLDHYLRVTEAGDDQTITPYRLRYFNTITAAQPESEPNDTPASGTPSGFTHSGVIADNADVDCFRFHGRVDDIIVLALDSDPEDDGAPANLALELYTPGGSLLDSADVSPAGGNEFIESTSLVEDGAYAYCVRRTAGTAGATASYLVGLVRNGGLYLPAYSQRTEWINPRSGARALVEDTLVFELALQNDSPVAIPGGIQLSASFSATCLQVLDTNPPATLVEPAYVSWDGQKTGLAPGEEYVVTITLRALAVCHASFYQGTSMDYFFTGAGNIADYQIAHGVFMPLNLRSQ